MGTQSLGQGESIVRAFQNSSLKVCSLGANTQNCFQRKSSGVVDEDLGGKQGIKCQIVRKSSSNKI